MSRWNLLGGRGRSARKTKADQNDKLRRAVMETLEERRLLTILATSQYAFDFETGHKVNVTFNQSVTSAEDDFTPSDLTFTDLTTGQQYPANQLSVTNTSGNSYSITFPGINSGLLPDGWYEMVLNKEEVLGITGGRFSSDRRITFFVFSGDVNRDRVVDQVDFDVVFANLGTSATYSNGDTNYDGVVDMLDFDNVLNHFSATLPSLPTQPGSPRAYALSNISIRTFWAPVQLYDDEEGELYWPDGHHIYRSTDGVTFEQVGTAAGDAYDFVDTGLQAGTKYWYRVRAYTAAEGESAAITKYSAVTVLTAPSDLQVANVSGQPGSVQVSWQQNSNNPATQYVVLWQLPGETYPEHWEEVGNASSAVITGLPEGQAVKFSVYAYTNENTSGTTPEKAITIARIAPHAVSTYFNHGLSGQTLQFTFDTNVQASVSADDLSIVNLTTGQIIPSYNRPYVYYVSQQNIAIFLSLNPPVVPPYSVMPPQMFGEGDIEVTLNAGGITNAAGVTLNEDTGGGDYRFRYFFLRGDYDNDRDVDDADRTHFDSLYSQYYSETNTSRTYEKGDLTGDNKVTSADLDAFNANFSRTIAEPPASPGTVAASAVSSTQISLNWAQVSGVSGYNVYRSTDGTNLSYLNYVAGASTLNYTDTNLAEGTKYWYRIRAVSGTNVSESLNKVSAVTLLPAPTNLSLTAASSTSVDVSWTSNSINESGFVVEWALPGQSFDGSNTLTVGAGATSTTITGLTENKTYSVRVQAYNSAIQSGSTASEKINLNPPTPEVDNTEFYYNQAPHQIKFTFNTDVSDSLSAAHLTLTNLTTGEQPDVSEWELSYDTEYNIATFTLLGDSPAILSTGNYEAILAAPAITNRDGVALAGNQDDGEEFAYQFQYFTADGNRDRIIDGLDLNITLNWYGAASGYATFSQGDYDYDRAVTIADQLVWMANLSTVLPPPPDQPGEVVVTSLVDSFNSLELSWQKVANVDGYKIYRSLNGTDFTPIATVGKSGAEFEHYSNYNLVEGTKYWYRIRSFVGTAISASVNKAYAITKLSEATGLRISEVGNDFVTVAWDAPTGSQSAVRLEHRTNIGSYELIGEFGPEQTTYKLQGVRPGDIERFRVIAVNAMIAAAPPPSVLAAPPGIPFAYDDESGDLIIRLPENSNWQEFDLNDLELVNISTGERLSRSSWTPSDDIGPEFAISFYAPRPGLDPAAPPDGVYEATIPNSRIGLSPVDGELSGQFIVFTGDLNKDGTVNNTDYQQYLGGYGTWPEPGNAYRRGDINYDGFVDAMDANLFIARFGKQLSLPPSEPGQVAASMHEGSGIDLSWANAAGVAVEKYGIFRSTDGVNFAKLVDVDPILNQNPQTYYDETTEPGRKYWYRVRAYTTAEGYTASVNKTWAVANLPSPANAQIDSIDFDRVTISWEAGDDNTTGFDIHQIDAAGNVTRSWPPLAVDHSATRQSIVLTGLASNTTYRFVIVAKTPAAVSAPLDVGPVVTIGLSAPSNLAVQGVGINQIILAWTDNSDGETEFVIEHALGNGAFEVLTTVGANQTTATITDVSQYSTMKFRVHAQGTAIRSTSSNVLILGSDLKPAVPINFFAEALDESVGNHNVHLTWEYSSNIPVERFEITESLNGGTFTTITTIDGESRQATVATTPGQTHAYRIRSVSGNRYSAFSEVQSLLAPPGQVRVVNSTDTALTVAWDDDFDSEDGYLIRYKNLSEGDTNWTLFKVLPANQSSAEITGLEQLTEYQVGVAAYEDDTESAVGTTWSATSAPPPTLSVLSINTKAANLSWEGNYGPQARYEIIYHENGHAENAVTVDAGTSVSGITIPDLSSETLYQFQVAVRKGSISPLESNVVMAKTLDPNDEYQVSLGAPLYNETESEFFTEWGLGPILYHYTSEESAVDAVTTLPLSGHMITTVSGNPRRYDYPEDFSWGEGMWYVNDQQDAVYMRKLHFGSLYLWVYAVNINAPPEPDGEDGPSVVTVSTGNPAREQMASLPSDYGTFTVNRTDGTEPITVELHPAMGTATYGEDYTLWIGPDELLPTPSGNGSFSVEFSAGESSKEITLKSLNDWQYEGDEEAIFRLRASREYSLPSVAAPGHSVYENIQAKVAIADDDPDIDIDIDSDNENGLDSPGRTHREELLEGAADSFSDYSGKFIGINNDDNDHDGIIDSMDGFNGDGIVGTADDTTAGEQFVPMIVSLPVPLDLSQATIRFNYDGDDPLNATSDSTLRLWKSTDPAIRDGRDVTSGGEYVAPGDYSASQLGITSAQRVTTLLVEGTKAADSSHDGNRSIKIYVDADGAGTDSGFVLYDRVRTTVLDRKPTGLTATANGSDVTLNWTDPLPTLSKAYNVYRASAPAGGTPSEYEYLATVPSDLVGQSQFATFTDEGAPNGAHRYYVTAVDPGNAESQISGPSAVVTIEETASSFAPSNVLVATTNRGSVSLTWTDNSIDEAGFRIQYHFDNGHFETLATVSQGATGTTLSGFLAKLPPQFGTHTFRIVAIRPSGNLYSDLVAVAFFPEGDEDEDGLTNEEEFAIGTDIFFFDSDGDLLPDGWEYEFGLDPLNDDEDDNGIPDSQDDFDGDGISNLGEGNAGSDPTNPDTDGDGVEDDEEINEGSDPNDSSDAGKPPADDMKAKFRLTVGDDSGSHSERWALIVGPWQQTAHTHGVVEYSDYYYDAGKTYDVRLKHVASLYETPDYDWEAAITPTPGEASLPYFIIDEDPKILGAYEPSTHNPVDGKVSKFVIPLLDADVDSDNKDGFTPPEDNREEDRIEQDPTQGKFIPASVGDIDNDKTLDFEDFNGVLGLKFVPMVIRLADNIKDAKPKMINGERDIKVKLTWANDKLRLWTKDGKAARNLGGEEYIESAEELYFDDLPKHENKENERIVYIEATDSFDGVQEIEVTSTITGDVWSGTLEDKLHVESPRLIAVDNNRDRMIKFDGSDDTTRAEPFVFWLNDNKDVWGGDEYLAPVTADPDDLDIYRDAFWHGLGSAHEAGNAWGAIGKPAAIKEVAKRDLEDFAQFGLRWPTSLEDGRYISISLQSSTDPGMHVNVFASHRKAGLTGNEFSATSHVDDDATIEAILAKNDREGHDVPNEEDVEHELGVGDWFTMDFEKFKTTFGAVDGVDGYRLAQLMFEGRVKGQGQLIIQIWDDNGVISKSSVNIRLRPANELYDHYTVAYGTNVNVSDGTFKPDANPLDEANPVPTTAVLLGQGNLERARLQAQDQNAAKNYFMFVHGWRLQHYERVAFAESTYKRMYWSGYKGQFGMFSWPTEWIDKPVKDTGHFDRSEYVAWNSATGFVDALQKVRTLAEGKLSVMAHSMGNIVLSEALYQNRSAGSPLVDTAIMSQAAISGHYYANTGASLPSIYQPHSPDPHTGVDNIGDHISIRTVEHGFPLWTEYKGFRPYGQDLDVIGGTTPRFRGIASAAGRILNYYNPDDFALATWRYDQMFKPTSEWSSPVNMLVMKPWIDTGNVAVDGSFDDAIEWLFGEDLPGYADTEYDIVDVGAGEYKIVRRYTGSVNLPDVQLSFANHKYEMFAFGASSIVAPVGGVNSMAGLEGVFASGVNLNQAFGSNSKFNNQNTGHSAQFVGSFAGVRGYWENLLLDIE